MTRGKVLVQFGCGWSAPDGWVNYDSSPTLRFERMPVLGRLYTKNTTRFPASVRYGDVVKGLPHAEGTVDGVYASHVLEHLALDDFRAALCHVLAILRPGGTFRMIVPDLEWRARAYLDQLATSAADANGEFLRSSYLGHERRPRRPMELLSAIFGGSAHLWMWDEPSLRRELDAAGFTGIRRCAMGDADEPEFRLVEEEGRFFDHGRAELAMQARKPG